MRNLLEITEAVDEGKAVHWKSLLYVVVPCTASGYLVKCIGNNCYWGLTSLSGELQGKAEDYYTNNEALEGAL